MKHIIIGSRKEIRRWIHRQEHLTGAKINYVSVGANADESACIIEEGTKESYPQMRIARRYTAGSEQIR